MLTTCPWSPGPTARCTPATAATTARPTAGACSTTWSAPSPAIPGSVAAAVAAAVVDTAEIVVGDMVYKGEVVD